MERPAGLPDTAFWSEDDNEWIVATRDDDGEYHGVVEYYRPDGTKCCSTAFEHGTPHGEFKRFHENGEVSRSGDFVQGQLHGTNVFLRSSGDTTENFPAGLGDHVARCEMDYDSGRVVEGRLYNSDGARIMESGEPFPQERPNAVSADAHFRKDSEGNYRWVSGETRDKGDSSLCRVGPWRYWSATGVLVREENYVDGELSGLIVDYDEDDGHKTEETEYRAGEKHGAERTFAADGTVTCEILYEEDDKQGPYRRRVEPGEMADGAIVAERGTHEGDSKVGTVEFLDAAGNVVASADRGKSPAPQAVFGVLEAEPTTDFVARAQQLRGEGQHPATLAALVRAVAGGADLSLLTDAVAAFRPPLSEDHAEGLLGYNSHLAEQVGRFGGPQLQYNTFMTAICLGCEAAPSLREAARVLDDYLGEHKQALEHVDVALALAPDRHDFEYTRALILMSLGRRADAFAAIEKLRKHSDDQADTLAGYGRALYPEFGYWPSQDGRAELLDQTEGIEEFTLAVDKLPDAFVARASAVELLRNAVLEQMETQPPWLVPSVANYLPGGKPADIDIDLDRGVVGLCHEIRRQWLQMCWASWLAGADELAVPDGSREPRSLPKLAMLTRTRAMLAGALEEDGEASPDSDFEKALLATTWFGAPLSSLDGASADFVGRDERALWELICELDATPPQSDEDDDE